MNLREVNDDQFDDLDLSITEEPGAARGLPRRLIISAIIAPLPVPSSAMAATQAGLRATASGHHSRTSLALVARSNAKPGHFLPERCSRHR
jgi:hypothetical protein